MDAEEIARVLGQVARDNEINCTGPGEVGCKGRTGWHSWTERRAHVAQSQAELLAPLVEQAKREAAAEFAHWVATHRAYNGSDHERGQSLYNECLNAVLPTWAAEWGAERVARGGAGGGAGREGGCGSCLACDPPQTGPSGFSFVRMYVCATCGNKRCGAARDCLKWECSGSNELGQIATPRRPR